MISLLSVSMDLPALDILHEWNHTVRGLLCPATFTPHVFVGQPGCSVRPKSMPLCGWPAVVHPSPLGGYLVCSRLWAIVNGAAVSGRVPASESCFPCFGV